MYDFVIIGILTVASLILVICNYHKPPFYFVSMNCVSCALYFGVFWTDLWTFGVVTLDYIDDESKFFDVLKSVVHLIGLPLVMALSIAFMHNRVSVNKFDSVRGKFYKHERNNKLFDDDKKLQYGQQYEKLLKNREIQLRDNPSVVQRYRDRISKPSWLLDKQGEVKRERLHRRLVPRFASKEMIEKKLVVVTKG